jgi:hypothetical protein
MHLALHTFRTVKAEISGPICDLCEVGSRPLSHIIGSRPGKRYDTA